ncbi:MAG: hypothetical protein A3F31_00085 [Candidatus Levybacteria bacterium RIFCSPHIGHO2_12_FULL_38_12]|nr:MAG: hypothetical protein A3F31_00085 [Candidatus Levybacteria bacterium RIFCSPHIGHO2_12_FULL_38_12]OGH34589.1 MAG: hypothetical protein A3A47_01505 [Candidatus Levybacteria bacterium RIFCSPLOWO2_01_FULL_37_20]OGH43437.1 MAG: hypothetical protein A3J14_04540 [Candidatus Levybacteria bacterium RIFCSPLOWO2_02_FULL_37_18]OGH51198.1 MAG: hypothetical protein A3G13_02810 [Candidatus Levybacteria bacterium RIFCSPLOWO2_12_FULL_37_7]
MDLFVLIRDRDKTLFHEKVKAISSYNEKGIFDVLPQHTQFITLIKNTIIIYKEDKKEEMKIEGGVMRVHENNVDIYIGVFPHPKPG